MQTTSLRSGPGQAPPNLLCRANQALEWPPSTAQGQPSGWKGWRSFTTLCLLAGGWPLMYQAMPALGPPSLLRDYLGSFSWASLAWQSYALATTWWMEQATGVPLDCNCTGVLTAQPSTATFSTRPQGRSDQSHLLARLPQNTKPR